MLLFYLCLCWCGGILFSWLLPLQPTHLLIPASLSFASILLLRSHPPARRGFLLLLLFELGACYPILTAPQIQPAHVQRFNDQMPCTLTGKILSQPEILDRSMRFVLDTRQYRPGRDGTAYEVSGKVQVYTRADTGIRYGDTISVYGLLETPPEYEGFSYRAYLARDDIHSFLYSRDTRLLDRSWAHPIRNLLFQFRSRAHSTVQALYPDPEASLLSGILLGIEGGISDEMMEAFRRTGTSHIIAISGFNITIIAAVFLNSLSSALGKRAGLLTAGAAVGLYTILVGADAAVVRAALMVSVSLLARLLGRQNFGYSALAAAVFVMTLVDPDIIHDVGFQLSAAATLGLLFYGPLLEKWFRGVADQFLTAKTAAAVVPPVNDFVLLTLAAQLTTLPFTIGSFQQISLISFVVNPIILPLQPGVMIMGGVSVLVGMVIQPAGQLAAWITLPFLRTTIRTVSFFADLPGGSIVLGGNTVTAVVVYCLLLITATLLLGTHGGRKLVSRMAVIPVGTALIGACTVVLFLWIAWAQSPDAMLHITVIPTGASEAVLIRSPSGRTVLLGCGSSPIRLSEAIGQRISPLFTAVDWLLLGSTSEEETAGLSGIIEQYEIHGILLAPISTFTMELSTAKDILRHEIPTLPMQAGHMLDFHDGVTLTVLSTGEKSSTYLVRYDKFSFFLMQGEDTGQIHELLARQEIQPVTAAILPGGGSIADNPPRLLQQLDPSLVLLSVEPGTLSAQPHATVLNLLEGRPLLRTDKHGWITLTTEGNTLWVETQYAPHVPDN